MVVTCSHCRNGHCRGGLACGGDCSCSCWKRPEEPPPPSLERLLAERLAHTAEATKALRARTVELLEDLDAEQLERVALVVARESRRSIIWRNKQRTGVLLER